MHENLTMMKTKSNGVFVLVYLRSDEAVEWRKEKFNKNNNEKYSTKEWSETNKTIYFSINYTSWFICGSWHYLSLYFYWIFFFSFSIPCIALSWIKSCLSDFYSLFALITLDHPVQILNGAPHGFVLGPLLFIQVSLVSQVRSHLTHKLSDIFYADDK